MSTVLQYADKAVLVAPTGEEKIEQVAFWLEHWAGEKGWSVRRGIDTVMVETSLPSPSLRSQVEEVLGSLRADITDDSTLAPKTVTIHCRYDGADLADTASLLGTDVATLVARHQSILWKVILVGFAPGFPYLVPVDPSESFFASVPRLASPRSSVPSGSVAIAAGMSAIYPSAMPGGWNLIGSTDTLLFDPSNEASPSLLGVGDHVRFSEVSL